ncbi:MAG: cytochrome P450 [Myxococcota bacterium]
MVEYNPYAYEIHEDPYPTYRRMRDEAPVYRNDELGFWALSHHADVLAGFKDVKRLSSRFGVSLDPEAFGEEASDNMSFLAMDPPRHTRLRSLVSAGFTPRRVAALEPRIREISTRYIRTLVEQQSCEFVADFAGKLPMDVVSELLGVPGEDRDDLRSWAELLVHREEGASGLPQAALDAALELASYFAGMLEDRRKRPQNDLTSELLVAELDGERLADRDVIGFLFLMIVAGNETTTKLLANAIYWLWRNPGERDRLRDDPGLIPRWVEETIRFDNSTQALTRLVTRDFELHGEKLREGDKLVLLIGSANRDERVWTEPDRYDILRDTSAMLSFGKGTHFCLGAALARLEARVALEEFQRRLPDYEIDPSGIERIHSVNVRGFAKLPVGW